MSRPEVAPEVSHDGPKWGGKSAGARHRHPAFGQIRASRISGRSALYGSDFMHQSYIEIVIKTSTLDRALSNDFYLGGNEVVRVSLSHAQWAAFVSQADIGDGTPCTLRRIGADEMPALPDPSPKHHQFAGEASDAMEAALAGLVELRQLIAESGLSGKKSDALLGKITAIQRGIGSNQQFVLDQFAEHMEVVVEKARIEVNAMTTAAVLQVGEAALIAGRPALELIASRQPGVLDQLPGEPE